MTQTQDLSATTTRKLDGKSAVVAAGAKNLGGLVSRDLAALGANVAVHYNSDSSRSDAEKTAAAVEEQGGKAVIVQGISPCRTTCRRSSTRLSTRSVASTSR